MSATSSKSENEQKDFFVKSVETPGDDMATDCCSAEMLCGDSAMCSPGFCAESSPFLS